MWNMHTVKKGDLAGCLDFVDEMLTKNGLKNREKVHAMLMTEECFMQLCDNTRDGADINVYVQKFMGEVRVRLTAPGQKFELLSNMETEEIFDMDTEDGVDDEAESAIRNILLNYYSKQIKYKNKYKFNFATIIARESDKTFMYLTMAALVLSIILGIGLRLFASDAVKDAIMTYIFAPFQTMFINAMNSVVAMIVFFSIASCISGFDDISSLGKIGVKVLISYALTSLLAAVVGVGLFYAIKPGEFGSFASKAAANHEIVEGTVQKVSAVDTIVNLIPSNIIVSFATNDTLQLIIIAVVVGIAVTNIGQKGTIVKDILNGGNELFVTITGYITKLIPVLVLFSTTKTVMTIGTDVILTLLEMAGLILLGFVTMLCIYCLYIWLFARLNPFIMFKKYFSTFLNVLSLSSASAAMPLNLKFANSKLGISKKVCGFSIPLGATVNMDGGCVNYMIMTLVLARLYGVPVTLSQAVGLCVTCMLVSMSLPGVPGCAVIMLTPMLTQIGAPLEGIALVLGIDAILDMFRAANNSSGDIATSLVVAKSEGLVDLNVYQYVKSKS